MKYERKSPYADGFHDIYTTAGVDADDVWARKHLLLGGDGGGADGSSNMDDANINDVGLALGGFSSVDEATAAQDAAAAEAAAQGAAQGEHDAYAAQVDLGPVGETFNFFSPIDITKTHDQFGRGVVGLDVSIPGVVGSVVGGIPGMALGTFGPAIGRGLGIDTNVSIGPQGINTGFATPGAVETAVTNAIGIDTSPGSFAAALSAPTDPGQTAAPSVDTPGISAGFDNAYRNGGAVHGGIGSLVSIR